MTAASLAVPVAVDVPYLPQTEALCGGAAAAMVFRYWGDAHAAAQQFAPLVDRRRGGIAEDVLVQQVEALGWRAERFVGTLAGLEERLAAGQPVIVLLESRGKRFHYVVVTGVTDRAVIVHDPSWGPKQPIDRYRFLRLWQSSQFWSLAILPLPTRSAPSLPSPEGNQEASRDRKTSAERARAGDAARQDGRCEALLDRAVDEIHRRGQAAQDPEADSLLQSVRAECPGSAGPIDELAGLRFAQRRWAASADLARQALKFDSADSYAFDLLGASLFMQDNPVGALRAWNHIGRPQLDSLQITGVHRARYQSIAEALDLRPASLLTADAFARASRRLDELPDRSMARLALRPDTDGFASVDVVIAERAAVPRSWPEMTGVALHAGVDHEASVSLPGFTGQGETWSLAWRWWNNRPRLALGFAAPRTARLVGAWRVEGSWEAETYRDDRLAGAPLVRESRAHGGVTVSDWFTGDFRYAVGAGFDVWRTGPRAVSLGGSVERRWLTDRVSLSTDATLWLPTSSGGRFSLVAARATARSSNDFNGWVSEGAIGGERASENAPLGLWPGAGDGRARRPLLRAHPLLHDGTIELAGHASFGRSLLYGSVEGQRWLSWPTPARLGIAGFVDAARAARPFAGDVVAQVDVGAGVRLRLPGVSRVLRVDAARGLRDGVQAITVGWLF